MTRASMSLAEREREAGACFHPCHFTVNESDAKLAGQEASCRSVLMPVAQPEGLETIEDPAPAIPGHDRVCL